MTAGNGLGGTREASLRVLRRQQGRPVGWDGLSRLRRMVGPCFSYRVTKSVGEGYRFFGIFSESGNSVLGIAGTRLTRPGWSRQAGLPVRGESRRRLPAVDPV